jgi:hypothetical protein
MKALQHKTEKVRHKTGDMKNKTLNGNYSVVDIFICMSKYNQRKMSTLLQKT